MEIHQLTYFMAVVETGSFTRAADRCHVAQPSLSQQIIKLEHELGTPLFDRLGRKTVLTDAGQALLPRATHILAELQTIRRGLDDEIETGQGTLVVGFIPTIAPFILPTMIQRFSQRFPQATLVVHEDLTEVLVSEIVAGKLDVAITSLPIHNKLVQTLELLTEPLLVASSRHYDIINRTSIQVRELDDFPFIALSEVHCLGEQVQSFCYQQDLDVNIVCHAAQLSTVGNCIALGLGVSLVPQAMAAQDNSGQIIYRALDDATPQRKIAAAYHIRRTPSFLGRHLIDMVSEAYHEGQNLMD